MVFIYIIGCAAIVPLLCYGFYREGRLDATKEIYEDLTSQLDDEEEYVSVLQNSGVNNVEVIVKTKEEE